MPSSSTDFLVAERLIGSPHSSEADFYGALQAAAERLVPVDAFYVCLVQREPEWLHFVFNCHGSEFDAPASWPFGDGPTSYVARMGVPVLLSDEDDHAKIEDVSFAYAWNACVSAIHWPLWIHANPKDLPDGVLCVQATLAHAYDTEARDALAWLARRTEAALRERDRDSVVSAAVETAALNASRNQAIADVGRFVGILEELAELRHDSQALLSEIRRREVELTGWAPTVLTATDELSTALEKLSERELEVLVHVAQGLSNEGVAEVLICSRHTIKRHLDNVYHTTPLHSRTDVANAGATIRALYMARTGH